VERPEPLAPGQAAREAAPAAQAAPVRIEVSGLSVHSHHGVTEAERQVGQRLRLDVLLEVERAEATTTDALEDTVDYGEVAREAARLAQERSHRTLERLCADLVTQLLDRFGADSVTVRAAKPRPPMEVAVEEVSVTLTAAR
jgi:dihydroneopterin aldolase